MSQNLIFIEFHSNCFRSAGIVIGILQLKTQKKLSLREKFRKASPVILILFGGLFIVRGMNLDIPYISPKVEINQAGEEEVSCCSKKGTEECVGVKKRKSRKSRGITQPVIE